MAAAGHSFVYDIVIELLQGGFNMKYGDVVCFRNRCYRVGQCMTNTSIELVELKDRFKGLWVSRDEINMVAGASGQLPTQDRRPHKHP